MREETIYVREAASSAESIQQIEYTLSSLDGVERVLIDTTNGKVMIRFDDQKILKEEIVHILNRYDFHEKAASDATANMKTDDREWEDDRI
jgi:hypothetical protein